MNRTVPLEDARRAYRRLRQLATDYLTQCKTEDRDESDWWLGYAQNVLLAAQRQLEFIERTEQPSMPLKPAIYALLTEDNLRLEDLGRNLLDR